MVSSNAGQTRLHLPLQQDVLCAFNYNMMPVLSSYGRWTLIAAELGRTADDVYSRYRENHLVPNQNRGG
jgi:hypothetical protein